MRLQTVTVLVEANVFNINEPYNGVSVQTYLNKMLRRLPDDVKGPLQKKLTKLITNDATILQPVEQLPQNAPEWAQAAAAVGDLKAFIPNDQINDRMEHIAHFFQALVTDSKDAANKDKAAVAQRELQGLPKVENLGVMYNKALEYFARGTKKVAKDVDGMVEVATTKGYTWYKLNTQEAFAREGKTLQNCIGRVYTHDRCVKDGTEIVVMRDRNDVSVVAMRVRDGKVQEFKGKQNKPPIPKYMPAVIEFIEHNNLSFASTSDLFNAGYVFDEKSKRIRSVDEVLEEQAKRTAVGESESGKKIFGVSIANIGSQEIRNLVGQSRTTGYYKLATNDVLYELSDGRSIVAACVVNKNTVTNIWDSNQADRWRSAGMSEIIMELINALGDKQIIDSLSPQVMQDQPITSLSTFNKKTRKFEQPDPTSREEIDAGGTKIATRTYTESTARALGDNIIRSIKQNNYYVRDAQTDEVTAERVTLMPMGGEDIAAVITTDDGVVLPYSGTTRSLNRAKFMVNGSKRENAIRGAIAKMANDSGASLPLSFCATAGIMQTENGYEAFTPEPIRVTPTVSKFDLTNASEPEAFIMTALASGAHNDGGWVFNHVPRQYGSRSETVYSSLTSPNPYGDDAAINHQTAPEFPSDQSMVARWNAVKGKRFRGKTPAALYFNSTTQTASFLLAVDERKHVLSIDTLDNFRGHKGGNTRAAAVKLVAQINDLIKKEGLTVDRQSTSGMSMTIFSASSRTNQLITSVEKTANAMGQALQDEFKLTYENSAELRRMTAEEFNQWQEKVPSIRGAANFYIIINPASAPIGVIATDKADKAITHVYSASDHNGGELSNAHFKAGLAKYVRTFAEKKGITQFPNSASLRDTSNSVARWFKALKNETNSGSTEAPLTRTARSAGAYWQPTHGMDELNRANTMIGLLVKAGYVSANVHPLKRRVFVNLTPAGLRIAQQIEAGQIKSEYQVFGGMPATASQKAAEPPTPEPAAAPENREAPRAAPTAPVARAPREAGGESKAARAMARFREMAAANGGQIPSRADFIAVLRQEPFNMSPAGASTYYHNIKVKYAQAAGQLGETFTFKEYITLFAD